jgi:hypothetical protein
MSREDDYDGEATAMHLLPKGGWICGANFCAAIAQNATSSPLRITGASLTGTRNITVDGVWADLLHPQSPRQP